jgi:hypothetical protein
MSSNNVLTPSYLENAQKMKELNIPAYKEQSSCNMIKVLETYKRSVDYYNSYGLERAANSTQASHRHNTERPVSASTTFWDDTLRF